MIDTPHPNRGGSMTRFALTVLTLYGMAAGAREATLEYAGRGAVQVLAAARALTGAQPSEGRWSVEGELLLQKYPGKLGGLATTSYGFAVIAGGKADRIKYAPL